jgi:hypothetical protein
MTCGREFIQPPTGSSFCGCNVRIFRFTAQETHLFEPIQRPIESSIRGQKFRVAGVFQFFGYGKAVESSHTTLVQDTGDLANCGLEGKQGAGLSSHGANYRQIYAYRARGDSTVYIFMTNTSSLRALEYGGDVFGFPAA